MSYPAHPAADSFPMMEGEEFDTFAADIRDHGLRDPIILLGNEILDGRNRQAACEAMGVTPHYKEVVTKDPIAYVTSVNLVRRHLTAKQRAAIAADLANLKHGGDRGNQHTGGKPSNDGLKMSTKKAADVMGVSTASVERAKKVKRENPKAHEAAKKGENPVTKKTANKKKKTEKTRYAGWNKIAREDFGFDIGSSGGNRDKLLKEMKELMGDLDHTKKENEKRLREALGQIQVSRGVISEEEIDTEIVESREALPPTAKDKLDRAIRAEKRRLEIEIEQRISDRIDEYMKAVLPRYSKEFKQYKAFNDSKKGILSETDYKRLLSCLHPDRVEEQQKKKFSEMFDIVKKNKEYLCPSKNESDSSENGLPSTLSELMACRK